MNRQQRKFTRAVIQHALKNSTHCDTWLEGEEWESNLTSTDYIMREIEHQGQAELVFMRSDRSRAGAFLFIDQDSDADAVFADYIANEFCDAAIRAGWEAIA